MVKAVRNKRESGDTGDQSAVGCVSWMNGMKSCEKANAAPNVEVCNESSTVWLCSVDDATDFPESTAEDRECPLQPQTAGVVVLTKIKNTYSTEASVVTKLIRDVACCESDPINFLQREVPVVRVTNYDGASSLGHADVGQPESSYFALHWPMNEIFELRSDLLTAMLSYRLSRLNI